MSIYKKIVLKKGKEHSLLRLHPWVFSGAIGQLDTGIENGDMVEVYAANGDFLGLGFYQKGSISVRIISFEKEVIDKNFWKRKIGQAYQLRKALFLKKTQPLDVYRLFHAEGDGVSGLILDVYGETIVVQSHNEGVNHQKEVIAEAISEISGLENFSIYLKSGESSANKSGKVMKGNMDDLLQVNEYGHYFKVDIVNGQKTGFFIDQRENRQILKDFVQGRNVLNAFSYTGGFSVYALSGGANLVHSVDSSESANKLCEENIRLNKLDEKKHKVITADVMNFIKNIDNQYDIIILDPPAFAKHQSSRHQAAMGYKRLNTEAFCRIRKNGFLFTFSCSQAVDRELFENTIRAAAIESRRKIKVLAHLGQPADHPVSIYHPEGEYLKGLICFVE